MDHPFSVHRIGPKGPDSPQHIFCVRANGCHDLVRTLESPVCALINGAGSNDPSSCRTSVQRLCDALNEVWDHYLAGEFHR